MGSLVEPILWVRVPQDWDHIKPLREFIVGCTGPLLGQAAAETAGMVANELLENAVKYGDMGSPIELEVKHHRHPTQVSVRVSNQARPARLTVLRREFKKLGSAEPQAAFSRAVSRLQKLPAGATMLGLARIMSQSDVDLEIEDSIVTLVARIGRAKRTTTAEREYSGKVVVAKAVTNPRARVDLKGVASAMDAMDEQLANVRGPKRR